MKRTTVTAESITFKQIRALRTEALRNGDEVQALICDIALDGTVDLDDYVLDLPRKRQEEEIAALTQEQACANAIACSAAQIDCERELEVTS
jgi:hypothetical protein